MAAFNVNFGEDWRDPWTLSPLMAVGGIVRMPFDILAAGPRAIGRTFQRQSHQLSVEKTFHDFEAMLHQMPGKAP